MEVEDEEEAFGGRGEAQIIGVHSGIFFLPSADPNVLIRILAGCTTGAMAVSFAQPTDVVKVRFQAQMNLSGVARRYNGTMQAYKQIYQLEGFRGLWKGFHTLLHC